MKKSKLRVQQYNHPNKDHTRDTWVRDSWHYNGAGYQKNKKKIIPRKQKYKAF